MARSFSSVLDRTKRPAPVWRCNSARHGIRRRASAAAADITHGRELGYPLETVYPEESVVGPDGTLTADGAA